MSKIPVMLDLKRVNGKIHRALTNSLKEYDIDITPVQGRILMFIDENKEVTATSIIDKFNSINKSTLSEILNNLEKNGYIVRNGSKEDSRKKILLLTDKSKDVIMILKRNFDKVAHKVLDDIPKEEYDSFKMVLDKIERNVDKLC
jgi:DNA-binding MarR family transcriptional regulator